MTSQAYDFMLSILQIHAVRVTQPQHFVTKVMYFTVALVVYVYTSCMEPGMTRAVTEESLLTVINISFTLFTGGLQSLSPPYPASS